MRHLTLLAAHHISGILQPFTYQKRGEHHDRRYMGGRRRRLASGFADQIAFVPGRWFPELMPSKKMVLKLMFEKAVRKE